MKLIFPSSTQPEVQPKPNPSLFFQTWVQIRLGVGLVNKDSISLASILVNILPMNLYLNQLLVTCI